MAASSIVLATRNPHKLKEFRRLIEPAGIVVEPLPEGIQLPPEGATTFAGNALPKARAAADAASCASFADDSGIEAAALDGAPGVRSARYAGERATDQENLDKLMREAPVGSPLHYVCALAYVDPEHGHEQLFFGYCDGRLAERPRGSRGFGYDPAFIPKEGDGARTMAELSDEEKDAISHRGNAARALLGWLQGR